ncbi:MAG: TnsA endonuclease N-terminal domain-containing protein [Pseudomonadota bacterium]
MKENEPDNSSKVGEILLKKLRQSGAVQESLRQNSCSAPNNVVRLNPGTALENVMTELSNRAKAARHERQITPSISGVTGWIQGISDGDPVEFESSLERDFAYKALFDEQVVRVISQPETFSLNVGGARANYTPDFLIEYMALTNQKISAFVEVKPNYRLNSSDRAYVLKLDAMSRYCRNRKHHLFFVVTEDDIHDQRLKNSRALFPLRFDPETFEDAREPIELVEANPGIHFAEIVSQLARTKSQTPFVVRSLRTLISTRDLWIDLSQEIRANSPVFNRRTKPDVPSFLEACVDWDQDPRREPLESPENDDRLPSTDEFIAEVDLSSVSDANWELARERFEAHCVEKLENLTATSLCQNPLEQQC